MCMLAMKHEMQFSKEIRLDTQLLDPYHMFINPWSPESIVGPDLQINLYLSGTFKYVVTKIFPTARSFL